MDIIQELGALAFASRLKRISERLMKDVSRVYKDQDFDFQARWFPVLFILSQKSPLSVTEIARELRLTHPAVNQIAGSVTKAGLLTSSRDKNDDRKRLLSLTPKGKKLVARMVPIWRDIELSTAELLKSSGSNLLSALDRIERSLDENDMYVRVSERIKKRMFEAVEIVNYRPQFKKYFQVLNREWLTEFFAVEPDDEKIMSDPNGRIIKKGGAVLFARLDGDVVGTTALIRREDSTFELTKMAVDKNFRRRQIGRRLLAAAVDEARGEKAARLVLLTSPKLKAALRLYRRFGFVETDMPEWATCYQRCSIFMTLEL
ncbi:MAG: GNAT family N-acetyltransferase [FCB group bacterium]|nr:GNAT family N-acetyltransferase [FCB group bacterium]